MVWKALTEGLGAALRALDLETPDRLERLELAVPRDPTHGDWTTNLALVMAKELRRPPRALAEAMAGAFPLAGTPFGAVEVAGPGFLNFRYSSEWLDRLPGVILAAGDAYGRSEAGRGIAIQVEYVSANPTGPLNIVSARAAAVGATLVRLLEASGHRAAGEYYVNDAGNQVDLLAESVKQRLLELRGEPFLFPESGYQGDYIRGIAREIQDDLQRREPDPGRQRQELATRTEEWFRTSALERMLAWQKSDLAAYGAEFSEWFHESTLHASGAVEQTLAELEARGMTYRATRPEVDRTARERPDAPDGEDASEATWLRTSRFGDEKDRVIIKGDGRPTYLLPDIAYHRDKHARGFRVAIDVWGPDHHGHILPLRAALGALGFEADFLEVLIAQQVNLLAGGQPVKMSKRAGEFITLRDLMDDVGSDCAKFFFLMRSTSAHLDFDLDLAKQQNDENPAFYVQYAHARIASVLRFALERDLAPSREAGALEAPEEIALARKLATFPEVVRGAAAAREPHRIPAYLIETAAGFHRFYHACRVVSEDAAKSRRRLALAEAARIVLHNGLALMGVSAPERMERAAEVVS